jgi:hypothetical protein
MCSKEVDVFFMGAQIDHQVFHSGGVGDMSKNVEKSASEIIAGVAYSHRKARIDGDPPAWRTW